MKLRLAYEEGYSKGYDGGFRRAQAEAHAQWGKPRTSTIHEGTDPLGKDFKATVFPLEMPKPGCMIDLPAIIDAVNALHNRVRLGEEADKVWFERHEMHCRKEALIDSRLGEVLGDVNARLNALQKQHVDHLLREHQGQNIKTMPESDTDTMLRYWVGPKHIIDTPIVLDILGKTCNLDSLKPHQLRAVIRKLMVKVDRGRFTP
jgi:hypothetical protein